MRILLLIPLTTLVLAQNPADQPQDKARLEGVLLNRVTGQPVRKALISLRASVLRPPMPGAPAPKSFYSVMSNAEGKFVFDQIDPGAYSLTADRNGYVHAAYRSSNGTLLDVGPGQTVRNIRIVITPLGVIAGHVVDEDGDPITEVRVQALRWTFSNGVRRLDYSGNTTVDDQGNFRLSNLAAAHYLLAAQFNRIPGSSSDNLTYVTTYYPSALDFSEATPIPLAAGGEMTNVEIRLHQVRVFHVSGKIVDSSGALVRNVPLALLPKNNGGSAGYLGSPISIPRDGTFDFFWVTPGSYFIQTAHNVMFGVSDQNETAVNKKLFARHALTVSNEDVKDIVVTLNAGATLTGVIVTEGAAPQPPPPDTSPANAAPPPPSVQLVPADSPENRPYTARSNTDGTFEMHDLGPERYRVKVNGLLDGIYVKSIHFGNEDVTNGILDLTSGTGGVIDVKLAPNAADVSGTVRNGNGETAMGVEVTLGPASAEVAAQTLFLQLTSTGNDGKFSFKNLPPGEYRICAWEEVDRGLVTDPEFRSRFDSRSVLVKLSQGSHESSDVNMLSKDAIEVEASKVR
jgi:hypothetical protein